MNKKYSSEAAHRPSTRWLGRGAALALAGALATSPAQAAFHLWNIRELYSNNSGSLQFIELFCLSAGQNSVAGQQISVTPTGGGAPNVLALPGSIPGDTTGRSYLIGTAGIQAAGAPAPDFVMQDGFLFAGGGIINFFGFAGNNPVVYSALPVDGINSRITFGGSGNAVNSPQNLNGITGTITPVPEPSTWTLLALSGFGLCFLLRRRPA